MAISEYEGTELHHADETREIEDFSVRVATVEDTGEIEKFCALVDFRPESFFERLFGVLES